MTNIPLLCNICPKEPEFSDVSHLLTHVASKGHLAQHNKAKLRAHQDASFREKLEAYDRWYQRHQIEKLLSERMIAKDSKDSSNRDRSNTITSRSTAPSRQTLPRRRRAKAAEDPNKGPSRVKIEGLIDPQLSRPNRATDSMTDSVSSLPEQPFTGDDVGGIQISPTLAATSYHIDPSAFLDRGRLHLSQRAPIPHMSRWQGASSPLHHISVSTPPESNGNLPQTENDNTDGESDYFQTFLRSPTRTAYPDPSDVTDPPLDFSIGSSSSIVKENDRDHVSYKVDSKDEAPTMMNSTPQTPVLRGVKWPGMSIFDSANLEAQRLRNQKKNDGLIDRMELNSAMVEQLERIYWPDGSLKAQRLITGDVESSPIRELTPPPKPAKRRRSKAVKSVLTELSTNVPRLKKKPRTRKASSNVPASQAADLQSISQEVLTSIVPSKSVYPRNAHMGYDPPKEKAYGRQLTQGLTVNTRPRRFSVFNDQEGSHEGEPPTLIPKTCNHVFKELSHNPPRPFTDASSLSSRNGFQSPIQPHPSSGLVIPSHGVNWESQFRDFSSKSQSPFLGDDSENIQPILDVNGRVQDDADHIENERVTQRYFTVTGNQPPQFFSSMPPGMDFGGIMEPRYYGSTLNPLNPFLRQQRAIRPQAYATQFSQAHGISTESVGNGENLMHPAHHGSGGGRVSRPRR